MLHALLHGKLDEANPEPQRLEDALTSTVLGAIAWAEAWHLLAAWLCPGAVPTEGNQVLWFWPRLAGAEPDVVVRVGAHLVVVEAKYRSGRHDLGLQGLEADLADQLVRQHRCITTPRTDRLAYPHSFERAIDECELVQAFLVDSRRLRRASRELIQSKERLPPGSVIRLVTWQQLFRLLDEQRDRQWASDLKAYLTLAGLDSFTGFSPAPDRGTSFEPVMKWRSTTKNARLRLLEMSSPTCELVRRLAGWRVRVAAGSPQSGHGSELLRHAPRAEQVIRAWRAQPSH